MKYSFRAGRRRMADLFSSRRFFLKNTLPKTQKILEGYMDSKNPGYSPKRVIVWDRIIVVMSVAIVVALIVLLVIISHR